MNRVYPDLTRRRFLQAGATLAAAGGLGTALPAIARTALTPSADGAFDLAIARTPLRIGDRTAQPITINGTVPGPTLRLREGTEAVLRVTNHLDEPTSIHWHGILLPFRMDGVPGVSFAGIAPGETFTYRFPVRQAGTYWYHSHSGLQEQLGHYGALVIDPAGPDPVAYDRDHVVLLSDWTFENPYAVFRKLKTAEGYYNYNRRTVGDFFRDVEQKGWDAATRARGMWGRMRMSSRDIADVTGATYTYLVNGQPPEANWTALFQPGERVRLRFINGSAMSYFDVRIPGLKMTVVQADGQDVEPVPVDEFRIGVAETYDVVVEPEDDRAYTLFAESMDRSGFARGTIAPREGMTAPVPPQRPSPERGMAAMGMEMDMAGGMEMDMAGMEGMQHDAMEGSNGGEMSGMAGGMDKTAMAAGPAGMAASMDKYSGPGHDHGPGAAMVARNPQNRMDEPGVGLADAPHKVLVYADLRSRAPWPDRRKPGREVELHLTGNMERYMWSFDGRKFTEVDGPVRFHHGERLRLTLVNDTMMDHPIHLHGMWMELDNGAGPYKPRKHTLNVKPGEKISAEITADAPGDWAFHCHLLYHMKAGMFRVVSVA